MQVFHSAEQFPVSSPVFELLKRRLSSTGTLTPGVRRILYSSPWIIILAAFALTFVTPLAGGIFFVLLAVLPILITYVDLLVFLPRVTQGAGMDVILSTPIDSKQVLDSLRTLANQYLNLHLRPFVITFWVLGGIVAVLAVFMIGFMLFLIPFYILYVLLRRFLLSCGMMLCLLPDGLRHSGVASGIRGAAVGYVLMVGMLPSSYLWLFSMNPHWASSANAEYQMYSLLGIALMILLPPMVSESFARIVLEKRRNGQWS